MDIDVHIDRKLNLNLHITIICKSASDQLNALVQSKRYLRHEERFVNSNYIYIYIYIYIYKYMQILLQ